MDGQDKKLSGASSSGALTKNTKAKKSTNKTQDLRLDWDPSENNYDNDVEPLQYPRRVQMDLKLFLSEPPPDIFLVPDSDNMSVIHAVIVGPVDTPYEGGFFYFYIQLPPNYPMSSPRVKHMTTDQNSVRFNPNLYSNGKVCLSILGTWYGPSWCAANNLRSILLSIQSLMSEKPYHNEPGYEEDNFSKSTSDASHPAMQYNDVIRHETIRVAVIGMLDKNSNDSRNMPAELREKIIELFKAKISFYEKVIAENSTLDGKAMNDPFERKSRK